MNIYNIIFIFGISLIPSLIMLGIILYSDRKSKEPFFFILLCSISGLFTITLALFIQNYLINAFSLGNIDNILSVQSSFRIFLLSSVEEYCKLFILYVFSHILEVLMTFMMGSYIQQLFLFRLQLLKH